MSLFVVASHSVWRSAIDSSLMNIACASQKVPALESADPICNCALSGNPNGNRIRRLQGIIDMERRDHESLLQRHGQLGLSTRRRTRARSNEYSACTSDRRHESGRRTHTAVQTLTIAGKESVIFRVESGR